MSKGGRGLTEDEKKLWRRVAARVKTRRPIETEAEPPPAPNPCSIGAAKPEVRATPAKSPPTPPQDRGGEKRVRRGRLEIGGVLDLHGHTQDTGRAALIRFLQGAQARGARTVIVITGVGRGGHGVLKRRLPEWLAEPELRAIVSGFAQAHRMHGGEGARYVFLRRYDAT